ncbi:MULTISPECIES: anti-sigma factor [unclassified Devosia]|uniref:anti-sigma factor family protein n=1 Tax=unclassified Devosia TaxID=196773 RepID=UPI0015FB2C57|nr:MULTISPECIES: anti-sigma factor [unclassified Devosia]MBJ6986444.1 anti-sigma factor [Devosia sp. MC521]MBK1795842.1 anti-sigma factor [Devosia sp. WQ 349K1]QMW64088.1 anti-sigma factor [Devosia sp. MC521]
MTEHVTDEDLTLYIDGQIDPLRRVVVEQHLARNPELAAQVIDELRVNHELYLSSVGAPEAIRVSSQDLARRLQNSIGRRVFFNRLRPVAAACGLVMVGASIGALTTSALSRPSPMPDYLEAALRAHEVSQVRAVMTSQPEVPEYDPAELLAATAIVMPTLPESWTVEDVQVYPSRFGPSVEMSLSASDLGRVSIFAARPGDFAAHNPTAISEGNAVLAHWQIGEIAYALVGASDETEILNAAHMLADTLY